MKWLLLIPLALVLILPAQNSFEAACGSAHFKCVSVSESLTLSNSLTKKVNHKIALSETITIIDNRIVKANHIISLFENVGIQDISQYTTNRSVMIWEVIGLNDLISHSAHYNISLIESVDISDSHTNNVNYYIPLSESVTINDYSEQNIGYNVNLNESIILSDSIDSSAIRFFTIILSEMVGVLDDLSSSFIPTPQNYDIILNENVGFNDLLVVVPVTSGSTSIILNELIGVSDNSNNTNTIAPVISKHISDDPRPSTLMPSFGGVEFAKFNDGLTINDKVFDISQFTTMVQIPYYYGNNTIVIKVKYHGSPNNWEFIGLYGNNTYFEYDRYNGIKTNMTHVGVNETDDSTYNYFTFSGITDITKITTWDIHHRANTVNIFHISIVPPRGTIVIQNKHDLQYKNQTVNYLPNLDPNVSLKHIKEKEKERIKEANNKGYSWCYAIGCKK